MDYVAINDAIRSAGVGLAGFEGAWWSPATQPFEMTSAEFNQLSHIGRSLFQYADAVTAEMREQPDSYFSRQLQQKVPVHIVETFSTAPMLMCRPDFQLVPTPDGVQLVLTEIEIAPFSAGCAHAMQIAYGIPADIAPAFARMLHGRELLFVGTHEWSWYLYDQFAFCKALAVHGARGRILYDRTFDQMETEIQRGERWQLPIPGIEQPPDPWQPGITAHISRFDLQSHVCNEWPEDLGMRLFTASVMSSILRRHNMQFSGSGRSRAQPSSIRFRFISIAKFCFWVRARPRSASGSIPRQLPHWNVVCRRQSC